MIGDSRLGFPSAAQSPGELDAKKKRWLLWYYLRSYVLWETAVLNVPKLFLSQKVLGPSGELDLELEFGKWDEVMSSISALRIWGVGHERRRAERSSRDLTVDFFLCAAIRPLPFSVGSKNPLTLIS